MSRIAVTVVILAWLSLFLHAGIGRVDANSSSMASNVVSATPTPDLGMGGVSGTDAKPIHSMAITERPTTEMPTTEKPTTERPSTAGASTAGDNSTTAAGSTDATSAGVTNTTGETDQQDCSRSDCCDNTYCVENKLCTCGCDIKPLCALIVDKKSKEGVAKLDFNNQCSIKVYNDKNTTHTAHRFYYEECVYESDYWDGSRVFPLVVGIYGAILILLAIAIAVLHGGVSGEYSVTNPESSTVVKNQAYVGAQ
ncbi:uncharacterized protein LOC134190525 [Corticium candelabrum]|uniref:uncharacterized protein LOC134190525 n=1 Tax=Corticium candelabrum TaxID=121492 RepID=UPI002E26C2BC|nr:uncharacterized protein LOC134190525 [Corticium candelabrum]